MRSISLLVHNIRSLWNVGSLFRSSDAFAVAHLYLTGYTACPPRHEITKTALQAETWMPWSYEKDPLTVLAQERKKGSTIVALEKAKGSIDLRSYDAPDRLLLIVGHEILGVPNTLLQESDAILHIPMHGKKESQNVAVAAGIALNQLRHG